jgi:hypothetical protein
LFSIHFFSFFGLASTDSANSALTIQPIAFLTIYTVSLYRFDFGAAWTLFSNASRYQALDVIQVDAVRVSTESNAGPIQNTALSDWPVIVIQLALIGLADAVSGLQFSFLTSLALLATPKVAASLSALLSRIIFHCATATQTLSHF